MSSHSRFIPLPNEPPERIEEWQSLKAGIAEALLHEIHNVRKYALRESNAKGHDSIYIGHSGIAFMLYHIAKMNVPLKGGDTFNPQKLIDTADGILAETLSRHPISLMMYSPTRLSFVETFVGIATLVLVRKPYTSEKSIKDNWKAAKDYVEYTVNHTLEEDNDDELDDGSEILYGRAGLLYSLLYLRNAVQDSENATSLEKLISDGNISRLVDSIVRRGKTGARLFSSKSRGSARENPPPLMWSWHSKRYLGAAHGVVGILQVLLSCPYTIIQKHVGDIVKTAEWVAGLQDRHGNWPTKSPDIYGNVEQDNELVQWCHGAPGVVILLCKLIQFIQLHNGDLKIDEDRVGKLKKALSSGVVVVYQKGLLRKGVGLCHGIGGSVYALLAGSDILDATGTGSELISMLAQKDRPVTYFAKAAHLAHLARFHKDTSMLPGMRVPDHPWSLYEGMAGMCCTWAEVLCRFERRIPRRTHSGFPAYDDLL